MIRTTTRGAAPMPMAPAALTTTDWRQGLPVLQAGAVSLRELRLTDAASLLEMLTTDEVARFISPPPTSVEGFERFIAWTHRERAAGRYICFGIVPAGLEQPVGIIQVRTLAPGFDIAEWGFAIGGEGETVEREIRLRRGASVRGRVVLRDGTPVPGATVLLFGSVTEGGMQRPRCAPEAVSGPDGSFEASPVLDIELRDGFRRIYHFRLLRARELRVRQFRWPTVLRYGVRVLRSSAYRRRSSMEPVGRM